ncbi:MAG TPA: hypothetical protein VGM12_08825 [Trebonia sp.]
MGTCLAIVMPRRASTGEAFTVQAHQRQAGRGGPAEFECHVVLRVRQVGEGDDRGRG